MLQASMFDGLALDGGALVDRIEGTDDPDTMICLAERWLMLQQAVRQSSPTVAWTARTMLKGLCTDLDVLSEQANMTTCQLRRLFASQMGVSPKLFTRIARFDRTVRLYNRQPDSDWLSIAIEAGYYDHQHMTRDFRDFTSLSPTAFIALERSAPERLFGQREQ